MSAHKCNSMLSLSKSGSELFRAPWKAVLKVVISQVHDVVPVPCVHPPLLQSEMWHIKGASGGRRISFTQQ